MQDNIIFDFDNVSDSYIDFLARQFMSKHSKSINKLSRTAYNNYSQVSLMAFQEIVLIELKKACYSFANNGSNANHIESYLFSCIHKTMKGIANEGKKNAHICPGCRYLSKLEILPASSKNLHCNQCKNALNLAKEKWEVAFYGTFAEHSKNGYACPECNNFIPENDRLKISCPYPDCLFAGSVECLESMRHPSMKANLEIPSINTEIEYEHKMSGSESVVKNDMEEYVRVLNECIDSQVKLLHFKSNESTLMNKICMYQAYTNMIHKYPSDMISYLVFLNRNVRMQHKIFQEFVSVLESKIPFSFRKNGKIIDITSIVSDNLCVFDGISEFITEVDSKSEIHNMTKELYVGSRKGLYCRPYYMGKVLDITDVATNESIISNMKEYSFFRIIMNDSINPGTQVKVKHLRIPPHYQMGGMVYLNRIRRTIVDKVHVVIHGKPRVISR